ncbi:MAG TPA: exo 1,3/1,4-beta-D-glucan glucohydrolase [Steroidobacteraceae bacterium]|nr:exo 1,3/1,4-beta-D-glucan glucohydrolase [Steroidobacteraceae bacterium]
MSPSLSIVRKTGVAVTLLAPILLMYGCEKAADDKPAAPAAKAEDPAAVHPEVWPSPKWPFAKDAALEEKVAALLKKMTVEEKVGQVIQGDICCIKPEDMKKYHLGSILAGGGSSPGNNERSPAKDWLRLADEFYDASVDTSNGGVGVPMIWGIDAMHGHSNIVGAVLFPHNVGLGATHNPKLLGDIARVTAEQVRTTGIEWTFAPTVTVPQDDRWGRAYEGYSEDPKLVASYAGEFVKGLQGDPASPDFLKGPHVISSTKHFLADGGTENGRDQGDSKASETELRDIHNAGYVPAIEAGVQTVMISFSSWQGQKLSGHKGLITDVLKKRMNFDGFTVGDWNGHGQVKGCTNDNCPQAFNAGMDMFMAPDSWKGLYENTLKQVKDGTISMERLDEAVTRILRVKYRLGVFDGLKPSKRPLGGDFKMLASPEQRAIARDAVRQSLVLLKNNGGLLPLAANKHVLVTGDGADNISKQNGGWTITWQGTGLNNADFPGATSVFGGVKAAVKAGGGSAEISSDGSFKKKPDYAIVVFGENPYAEFQGDLKVQTLPGSMTQHLEIMKKLQDEKIPVVAVLFSGRPLWQNRELNLANAYVAAWLPGTEGGGIADVLFRKADGSVNYDFTGKLSYSWPRDATGKPLNVNHEPYDPLFAFGFGLTYAQGAELAALPEDPGIPAELMTTGSYFDKGLPVQPWSLRVSNGPDSTRITTTPAEAIGGRVKITSVDDLVQEGARRFVFDGSGPATVSITSEGAVDISRETNGDVMLLVRVRRDAQAPKDVTIGMSCGANCGGTLPVADTLNSLPAGKFTTLGIMLKCFQKAGVDVSKVDGAIAIASSGKLDVSFSQVKLGTVADKTHACN